MAEVVMTDAHVSVDTNDLSQYGTSVAISMSAEAVEFNGFGDTHKRRSGGILDWAASMEFETDAAGLDAILFPLVGQVVTVTVRADSAVASTDNPEYSGEALITEYTPLDGNFGEKPTASLSVLGDGPLTRDDGVV